VVVCVTCPGIGASALTLDTPYEYWERGRPVRNGVEVVVIMKAMRFLLDRAKWIFEFSGASFSRRTQ